MESTQCVVEAPLTDAQLVELHDSLIRQRIDDLLESGVPLTKYLDETTVVRTRAVGFSLGIGKWFKIPRTSTRSSRGSCTSAPSAGA